MDECSELSLGEYLLRFPDAHTALSDACILQAAECGRMYCERSEDVYKGFVCTAIGSAEEHILYAYTRPAYRGRGIFSSLVKHVVQTGDRDVRISIPEKHPCFTEVDAVCERLGFIPSVRMHTFTVTRSQKEQWQKIKEAGRYDACCARMLCHGCEVVSFAEAGEATISQIRDRSCFILSQYVPRHIRTGQGSRERDRASTVKSASSKGHPRSASFHLPQYRAV